MVGLQWLYQRISEMAFFQFKKIFFCFDTMFRCCRPKKNKNDVVPDYGTNIIVTGINVDDESNLPKTPFEDSKNAFIWLTVHEQASNLKDLQLEGFVITQQHENMCYFVRLRKPRWDHGAGKTFLGEKIHHMSMHLRCQWEFRRNRFRMCDLIL